MDAETIIICVTVVFMREISRLEFDQKAVESRTKAGLKSLILRLSFVTNVFLLLLGFFRNTNNHRDPPSEMSFAIIIN